MCSSDLLANRNNPAAFEPRPEDEPAPAAAVIKAGGSAVYTVDVQGERFVVQVSEGGDVTAATPVASPAVPAPAPAGSGETIAAPLAGNIFKVNVRAGDAIAAGDVVLILEAMKMETEVRAANGGTVSQVLVSEGDAVNVGDTLVTLG